MQSQGREPYGEVSPRVKEVWVAKDQAKVIDCQDMANAGMADATTHKPLPASSSTRAAANVEATLKRDSSGRWLLTGLTVKEAPCTPPSP
ncbi:hypothetical protein DP939_00180 [Spongiactinospora rosea]|uniref:Uncharacterized protein n=1 Tax=Spongiactinospora rosea TaxID=2248750 RepID=A0A366M4T2_9ACTN|nr:hypothetical protein [Spongiactinospora rosea]RBQ21195.1 hypothetical protein DP939_00180 [Spongiactinospora rosea]